MKKKMTNKERTTNSWVRTEFDLTVDEGKEWLNTSSDKS